MASTDFWVFLMSERERERKRERERADERTERGLGLCFDRSREREKMRLDCGFSIQVRAIRSFRFFVNSVSQKQL